MFRYKLKNLDTNEIKAQMELIEDVENPWSDKFEKFDIFAGMHNAREASEDAPAREKNYEIIKEDISYEQKLKSCLKARRREYPSLEEVLHAMLDSGDLSEIQAKRALIKAKYPKPEEI